MGKFEEIMSLSFDPLSASITVFNGLYEFLIKPILDERKFNGLRRAALESSLEQYLKTNYAKLSLIKTIAYHGNEVELSNIYYPLTISSSEYGSFEINSNCHFVFDNLKRIMITDYAGMGKSTLSKYIFIKMCEKREYLPIFVELRRVKRDKSIINIIREDLGSIGSLADPQVLQDLFSMDRVLLILDGFDEIALDLKDTAIAEITDIVSRYPSVNYLLTSRKDGLITLAPSFDEFKVEGLNKEDVELILRLYDPADLRATSIIEDIQKIEDESFHKLLENPMMVTLLFRSYSYNNEIPAKTHLFYDQVYKSLFNGHDLLKGHIRELESSLDVDQLQNILSYVAIKSLKDGPSYDRVTLISLIKDGCRQFNFSQTKAAFVLSDLLQAVPLFSEEGHEIRWVHKSFQDYFSAYYISFIADDSRHQMFSGIMKSKKSYQYSNTIEMCYDMKPLPVEEDLFLPLVDKYLDFAQHSKENAVSKELYDSIFLKAMVFDPEPELIATPDLIHDPFVGLRDHYLQKLSVLIPENEVRMGFQSIGNGYIAMAESSNYWIFELFLRLNQSLSKRINVDVYGIEFSLSDRLEKNIIIYGHNNVNAITPDDHDLVKAALSSRGEEDYATVLNEFEIDLYKSDLNSRIQTLNIQSDF